MPDDNYEHTTADTVIFLIAIFGFVGFLLKDYL